MRPAVAISETPSEVIADGPDSEEDLVIVDDDSLFTTLLGRQLRRTSRRYRIFNDSAAALAYLEQANPRTLLIDLRMPGLDGVQLLEALGNSSRAALPNVFVCSSCVPQQDTLDKIGSFGARLITKDALLVKNALLDLLDDENESRATD